MTKEEFIEKIYIPELLNPVLNKVANELPSFRNEDYIELFTAFYQQVKQKEQELMVVNFKEVQN